MPTFCRHNRFLHNCPICREPEAPANRPRRSAASGASAATRSRGATSSAGRRAPRPSGDLRVRRLERAADDGYANPLVPGLRASADARRLAEELGFAAGRLAALAAAPPGLYAEAASEPDREEALWLLAQIAVLGPLEGEDPFANVRAARTRWADGAPASPEALELGPRAGAADSAGAARALAGYRAWAGRAGTQAAALCGEPSWTPERRFERAYERLGSLPGLTRPGRYELLVCAGRLGLLDVRAGALHADERDGASLGARRAFAIADRLLLERRAAELAEACELPLEALDLALHNWEAGDGRAAMGLPPEAADAAAGERAAAALGVAED